MPFHRLGYGSGRHHHNPPGESQPLLDLDTASGGSFGKYHDDPQEDDPNSSRRRSFSSDTAPPRDSESSSHQDHLQDQRSSPRTSVSSIVSSLTDQVNAVARDYVPLRQSSASPVEETSPLLPGTSTNDADLHGQPTTVTPLLWGNAIWHMDSDPQMVPANEILAISPTAKYKIPGEWPPPNQFYHCKKCGVTWLEGWAGADEVEDHPNHCASHIGARSAVIWVDAATFTGPQDKLNGKYSVFFAPNSPFNFKLTMGLGAKPELTLQYHALIAAIRGAVEKVRAQRSAQNPFADEQTAKLFRRFRLVVCTPLEAVRELFPRVMGPENRADSYVAPVWKEAEQVFVNPRTGEALEGRWLDHELLRMLLDAIEDAARVGVQIKWKYCPWGRLGMDYNPGWDVKRAWQRAGIHV